MFVGNSGERETTWVLCRARRVVEEKRVRFSVVAEERFFPVVETAALTRRRASWEPYVIPGTQPMPWYPARGSATPRRAPMAPAQRRVLTAQVSRMSAYTSDDIYLSLLCIAAWFGVSKLFIIIDVMFFRK